MQHVRVHPTQEAFRAPVGLRPPDVGRAYVDRLLGDTRDERGNARYSASMGRLLSVAAGWAYSSDAEMVSNVLHRNGLLDNHCEYIGITNDALFVCARAYFIQSQGGRLGILCFRGTEPSNILSWMTDASVAPDPFIGVTASAGQVHGGFYRNVMALWPSLLESLEKALQGRSVSDDTDPTTAPKPMLRKLEALYITGHSLGGAMAALAGALLYQGAERDRELYVQLRRVLRGVYTYGQPMVGDAAFAKECGSFDSRLFRHVYKNDIVPHMPPLATGRFTHFGREYHWSDTTQQWEPGTSNARQVRTLFVSSALGVLDWFGQQLASLRRLKLALPYSWEAHSPVHYMRTAIRQTPRHRSEFGEAHA
ncbi:lipase family protein [Archangium sp.]|uniref:lipase family protein n=1 Tax=Archangium sp. TaxID=1872627 RepID=UPI003899A95D